MLNEVRNAIVTALNGAGISAAAAYPHTAVPGTAAFIRVGISDAEAKETAMGSYLGLQNDPVRGLQERNGMLCRLTVCMDIYAPFGGTDPAGDCMALFDSAVSCVSGCGIRVSALHCAEAAPDQNAGMMHLRGEVQGTAVLVILADSADTLFTDFVLRGELNT